MAEQARALYDFIGQKENGELTFNANEVLTIVNQNIGGGWWEAVNSRGNRGFIPETYVEITSLPEPAFPPPPCPEIKINGSQNLQTFNNNFSTRTSNTQPTQDSYRDQPPPALTSQESYDGWYDDDEWDDDEDDSSTVTDQEFKMRHPADPVNYDKTTNRSSSPNPDASKYGTVKKSFSRFSTFGKSGGESYLLGQMLTNSPVVETDLVRIVDTQNGPHWEPSKSPYTCTITHPHKESKLKGLKSFIAYQLTPSFSSIQVSRRYKHFDWLHERLEEKFICSPIAPLPEKVISGRYEDDFVSERMRLLQIWLNRMVRHPVISQCEVMQHFLTCTDDKKWKQGKRRAEKDEYISAKFYLTVQTPTQPLDIKRVEGTLENFQKFVHDMDDSLKNLIHVTQVNMKHHHGPFKREFQKIGSSIQGLVTSFKFDSGSESAKLTNAMEFTANTYNDIGSIYENQPRYDTVPLLGGLLEYKGLLSNYPDVLKIQEGALSKAKECTKQKEEGKLSESDVQDVIQRADVISYCTIAEMKHFQHERVNDFNRMMKSFLMEQVNFYKQITKKLEDALKYYE